MIKQTHRAFATTFTAASIILYDIAVSVFDGGLEGVQILPFFLMVGTSYLVGPLPDIDERMHAVGIDTDGRVFKHRGFSHTIWVVLALFILALMVPGTLDKEFIFGFMLGWLSHLVGDAFSNSGVAWFYPFQKYKKYPDGGVVVEGNRGPFIPLYRVGVVKKSKNETWAHAKNAAGRRWYLVTGSLIFLYVFIFRGLLYYDWTSQITF